MVALACASAHGCGSTQFVCQADDQCQGGTCEAVGYCSFPDGECESGRRYGSHAAPHLEGQCVAPAGTTDLPPQTGGGVTTAGPTTTGAGSSSTSADSSPLTDGSMTTEASSDSMSSSSSSSSSSTTGAPPVRVTFADAFDRADSNTIGNDWTEKNGTTWQLVGGEVVFESSAQGYEDNIVFRPEAEDLADVEVSIEFWIEESDVDNHPQVHARLDRSDLELPGSMTGYILYIDDLNLIITRQIDGNFSETWPQALAAALVPDDLYRLTLRVTDSDPVDLEGRLDHFVAGDWVFDTEVVEQDADDVRVTGPGAVGFSGADAPQISNLHYDSFTATDLTPARAWPGRPR